MPPAASSASAWATSGEPMNCLVRNMTFVAFDLETTGLKPVHDSIIEIGAVKFQNGQLVDQFEELINPGTPIPAMASQINGISDQMVADAPGIEEVLPRFIDFIGGATLIAHNAPFDVGFISYDIARLGVETAQNQVLDTLTLARRCLRNMPSYSLGNLARQLNISLEDHHRALSDAQTCRLLFEHCLNRQEQPISLNQLMKKSGPALKINLWDFIFTEKFHELRQAFAEKRPVMITYRDSAKQISERKITPISIGLVRRNTMLEAYCHLRGEKRTFRLDRITGVGKAEH